MVGCHHYAMTDTAYGPQVGRRLEEDRRRTDTRDKVAEMRDQGIDPRTIALRLGISTQQVYRHLRTLEEQAS